MVYAASRSPLQVAYEEADITPPLGGSMPGYFQDRQATGQLDPLKAKVLYLREGQRSAALVALDLIGMGASVAHRIRADVVRNVKPAPDHVWLHCSHTHTGGMLPRADGFTSDAEKIYPGFFPGKVDEAWLDQLVSRTTQAIGRAVASASAEAAVTLHEGRADRLAFYRRFYMKDGSLRTNPGRGNPEIVRPAGEVDPRVHVLRFRDRKTLAVFYGLHPDCVGGSRYSADYPAHLTATLRRKVGALRGAGTPLQAELRGLYGHPRRIPGEIPLSPGRNRLRLTALFGGTAMHGCCAVPTARRAVVGGIAIRLEPDYVPIGGGFIPPTRTTGTAFRRASSDFGGVPAPFEVPPSADTAPYRLPAVGWNRCEGRSAIGDGRRDAASGYHGGPIRLKPDYVPIGGGFIPRTRTPSRFFAVPHPISGVRQPHLRSRPPQTPRRTGCPPWGGTPRLRQRKPGKPGLGPRRAVRGPPRSQYVRDARSFQNEPWVILG